MHRLPSGHRLGPYQIVSALGAGGMGDVYRARDPRLERDVAIKVLPERLSASADLRARFEREARTLSRLNHPHICTLHDVGHDGGIDYLVMEVIEGETLAQRLERGPLPVGEMLAAALQIAGALVEAHGAGLVHRDLKPANMMLTHSGVKLLDFGLAAPVESRAHDSAASQSPTVHQPLTAVGALVGTYPYMAPEQLEGREADERSDVFAFGCVLFEMATGRRAFEGNGITSRDPQSRGRSAAAPWLGDAAPRALEQVVRRCLETDPARRFAGAAELRDELARLLRWPDDEGVPALARLCERILVLEEGRESWDAFLLAREIDKLAPGHPMLERLRPEFSLPVSVTSDPPGASVFATFYGDPDGECLPLGTTPLHGVSCPRGLMRLRLELPGRRTAHDLVWNLSKTLNNAMDPPSATWHYTLREPGEVPDGMEEVPAGEFALFMPGLDHLDPEPTGAFLIDRHPVTNREFKRFLDDGGYEREELWTEPFVEGERELPWAEGVARLTDSVGRPGPAGWEMGDFPAREDDHPVSGISWYEAAAFAAWAGKELPTLFHWNRVAFPFTCSQIVPFANLSGRAILPVGSTRSENRFGVHDLAGNVREWMLNPVNRPGQRFILGGGWNDPGYSFVDAYAQDAFDRSPSNGFRCIRALAPDPRRERLERTIEFATRDFRSEQPVPDEVFGYFLRQFHYDRTPLDAVLVGEQAIPWGRWQTVEFAAAYGRERMQVHVCLPLRGRPPYQTVVLFPGSQALHNRAFNLAELQRVDFLVKGGRAVVLPIYKSTFERGDELVSDYPDESAFYKDHVVMWAKDLGRTLDYIETRPDLDAGRVAYFGTSWGGTHGSVFPAIEKRFKVNVLYVAGLCFQRSLPEVDQINFVGRVTQPTLMLNGELDFFFPAETSQKPMFERLGTPAEHKRRLTYPRGHTVPKVELIKESQLWLDRYLGPVTP